MRKPLPLLFLAATLALPFAGCSGPKIAHDQVDSVKSVALIGFSVQQRMPNTALGLLGKLTEKKSNDPFRGVKSAPIAQPADHARIMYDSLQKELAHEMQWKVLARQDLVGQADYTKLYAEKTKQPQLRPTVSGSNIEMFVPDGIVESFLLTSMSMDERRALIRKLGVDAVAIVNVQIELERDGGLKELTGNGSFRPKAKVAFRLYNAVAEDPIWMEINADGDEGAPTQEALGLADQKILNQQAVVTADSAFHALIAHYRGN